MLVTTLLNRQCDIWDRGTKTGSGKIVALYVEGGTPYCLVENAEGRVQKVIADQQLHLQPEPNNE